MKEMKHVKVHVHGMLAIFTLAIATTPLHAQSEDILRRYFEGKTVVAKIDMPGTDEGVDVFPGWQQPIDYPNLAKRLKRFGTAVHRGEDVMVTKIKVKKDLIEFQLAGGGYGTFGDDDSPDVSVSSAPKTQREKNLEKDIKTEKDPEKLKKMKEDLDALRRDREREDSRNHAEAEQAKQIKVANIRQRRLEGGSRFNIRFKPVVPAEAMTPAGVMNALSEYLDFDVRREPVTVATDVVGSDLRKGLLVERVDQILGRPTAVSQRMEGTLRVTTATYQLRERRVTAEFVEGVLIRYSIIVE